MRVGTEGEGLPQTVADRDGCGAEPVGTTTVALDELMRMDHTAGAATTHRPLASARRPVRPKRSFRARFWRDFCVGAVLVALAQVFIVQVSVVRGVSMSPSLRDGDRLVVDRISYSVSDVARFDVVVLRYPRKPDVDFVKRVVGLPGDSVELNHGSLRVNGVAVPETFGLVRDPLACGRWVVPEGSYFVLGDNRPISCDSREFGVVEHELLKGKVRVVFWPPSHFSLL